MLLPYPYRHKCQGNSEARMQSAGWSFCCPDFGEVVRLAHVWCSFETLVPKGRGGGFHLRRQVVAPNVTFRRNVLTPQVVIPRHTFHEEPSGSDKNQEFKAMQKHTL